MAGSFLSELNHYYSNQLLDPMLEMLHFKKQMFNYKMLIAINLHTLVI